MNDNNLNSKVCQIVWHTFLREMRKKFILLAFIIPASCTIEIPFEVESIDKQLVVNSVFSTDKPFIFHFSTTSSPVLPVEEIQDSLHFILYENDVVMLDTNVISKELLTCFVPRPKKSYAIEVFSEDCPPVRANDTLPGLVYIDAAMIIIPAGIDEYGDETAEAQITFTDPPYERNYYELLLYSMVRGEPKGYWQHSGDSKIIDPVLINEGDMDYLPSSYFFSDELFDGKEYTLRVRSKGGGFGPDNGVTLRSVSRSYYLYRKFYTRHAHNQQFQGDFLDIVFMGEPQNMYTNIENGYGIFVGYQETSRILIPK